MKKIIFLMLWLLINNNLFACEISIYYPSGMQELCRTTPLVVKWNGSATDVIVEIKKENDSEYKSVFNYHINDNTFLWTVNDAEYLNVPLSVRVSDKNNPDNYDEFHGITVLSETEILQHTQSVQVCSGEDIYMQIDALGYNLSYQWYKDNQPINGAVSSVLRYSNADYSISGTYVCKINSNSPCGTMQSNPISVYVAAPTKFTTSPEEVFWEYNKSATMTAVLHANNEPEINNVKFRWFKDTVIFTFIPPKTFIKDTLILELKESKKYIGTNSQDLEITKLVWNDRTTYYCVADGLCGSDTVSCVIGDESRFEILKDAPDFYGCEGQDVKFKAKVITNVEGTFTYQWYKTGFKKLIESDKFIGTQTKELTIKNVSYHEDLNNYYVLVTWVEKKVYKRSEHFKCEPEFKPAIILQPLKIFVLGDPPFGYNDYAGQTHIYLTVHNYTECKFEWFRNDSLVRTKIKKFESNYWLGEPEFLGGPPIPRPYELSDTGVYRCRISNECGETWSDSSRILPPNKPVIVCEGSDIELKVFDMNTTEGEYIYRWTDWDFTETIVDDNRHSGATTNILKIKDVNLQNVMTNRSKAVFYASATNILNGQQHYLGKTDVYIKSKPILNNQLPQIIKSHKPFLPEQNLYVASNGPNLSFQYYKDGKPWGEIKSFDFPDTVQKVFIFVFGGTNTEFESGIYYIKYWNDCGETNSRQFEITIVGGIVKNDDDVNIINNNDITGVFSNSELSCEFLIYPNPAEDFITIQLQTSEVLETSEVSKVQIFNTLGIDVSPAGGSGGVSGADGGGFRIDVSTLPSGVYYIKIGNKVEKFVKM